MKLPPTFQKMLTWIGPAALVACGSGMFIILPKTTVYRAEQEKLRKLISQTQSFDLVSQSRRLDGLRDESEKLTQQLGQFSSAGQRLVSKSGSSNTAAEQSTPAQAIAELIQLFEVNGLKCLSCKSNLQSKGIQFDSTTNGGITRTESSAPPATNVQNRREVLIDFEGTYLQLQKSLGELHQIHGHFEIAAITMGDANAQSALRLWKLRVIV